MKKTIWTCLILGASAALWAALRPGSDGFSVGDGRPYLPPVKAQAYSAPTKVLTSLPAQAATSPPGRSAGGQVAAPEKRLLVDPAAAEQTAPPLLRRGLVHSDSLVAENKLTEHDRAEIQKYEDVELIHPPEGQKILPFKNIDSAGCNSLTKVTQPLALSVDEKGTVQKAEYLHDSSENATVPRGLWNCHFAAKGQYKGQAFMTIYLPATP